MLSQRSAQNLLDLIGGRTAIFTTNAAWIALFTTAPTADDGSNAVEVSGGGYTRVSVAAASWGTPGSSPLQVTNTATINFPTATASWGSIVAWGIYDAQTAGNLIWWDWLGPYPWEPVTISAASPAAFTVPTHGFGIGDNFTYTTVFGGTLPTLA
jgi:hypothetical protein